MGSKLNEDHRAVVLVRASERENLVSSGYLGISSMLIVKMAMQILVQTL